MKQDRLCLLFLLLASTPCWGHDLHLFVTVEGNKLVGRASFSAVSPAAGCSVEIVSASRGSVGKTVADADGRFEFTVEIRDDYEILVRTSDLHQATHRIRREEFSPDLAGSPVDPKVKQMFDQAVQQQFDQDLRSDVRALREQIDRLENAIGFRDIVGGIGFIVGITGLYYFLMRRTRP